MAEKTYGTEEKTLAQILIQDLFSAYVVAGEGKKYTVNFPVKKQASDVINNLPYLIPPSGYHPEIFVTIDFTHQFTVAAPADKVQGARLVHPNVLNGATKQLINFFSYYFEYVLTYKEQADIYQQSVFSYIVEQAKGQDEFAKSLFINEILNWFLTRVTVTRNRSDIGTCSIELRDNVWYNKKKKSNIFLSSIKSILNQLFVPMLPVMVWSKGRFYKDWYFPIFDGLLMRANPSDSQGFTQLRLDCKDILELARVSTEMINPALIQVDEFQTQTNVNIYNKPFYNHDHMEIFKYMFLGGNLVYKEIQTPASPESTTKAPSGILQPVIVPGKNDDSTAKFSALEEFDISGTDEGNVKPPALSETRGVHKDNFSLPYALRKTMHWNQVKGSGRKRSLVMWGEHLTPYRIWQVQSPAPWTSEFSSRLEILRQVCGMLYYEMYVDEWGNINYHPMRFSNTFLLQDIACVDNNNTIIKHDHTFPGIQVISPEETINLSKNFNIEEMYTFLRLIGQDTTIPGGAEVSLQIGISGSHTDKSLMSRFGYRRYEVNNPLFGTNPKIPGTDKTFLDKAAAALLQYKNGELYTCDLTIVFRPELQLSMPLYLTSSNEVFYVQSFTHSITVGGDASTTISANFGRKDNEKPIDILSFIVDSEQMFKNLGLGIPKGWPDKVEKEKDIFEEADSLSAEDMIAGGITSRVAVDTSPKATQAKADAALEKDKAIVAEKLSWTK